MPRRQRFTFIYVSLDGVRCSCHREIVSQRVAIGCRFSAIDAISSSRTAFRFSFDLISWSKSTKLVAFHLSQCSRHRRSKNLLLMLAAQKNGKKKKINRFNLKSTRCRILWGEESLEMPACDRLPSICCEFNLSMWFVWMQHYDFIYVFFSLFPRKRLCAIEVRSQNKITTEWKKKKRKKKWNSISVCHTSLLLIGS